ncbi:hypothetical protein TNCV_3685391 [Trichonephila clavipes]|nr:hypothetical protein TNCV_3685391 [Trichonephila clavipes]
MLQEWVDTMADFRVMIVVMDRGQQLRSYRPLHYLPFMFHIVEPDYSGDLLDQVSSPLFARRYTCFLKCKTPLFRRGYPDSPRGTVSLCFRFIKVTTARLRTSNEPISCSYAACIRTIDQRGIRRRSPNHGECEGATARDSRSGRRASMTSIESWSERTEHSSNTQINTAGLGAISPSRTCIGNEYIAEHSDLFRETIVARNVYSAWARKLTTAKPDDPDFQNIHLEVGKSVKNQETKKPAAVSPPPPPPHPVQRVERRNEASIPMASLPPSSSFVKRAPLPVRPLHPPLAPSVEGAFLEGTGEEEIYNLRSKIRCDWRQLVALAKLIAPSFQSQMSGRFLKVTVSDEVEYKDLSRWLENSGVELGVELPRVNYGPFLQSYV